MKAASPRAPHPLRAVRWTACLCGVAWSALAGAAAAAAPEPERIEVEQSFFVRQLPVDDGTSFNSTVGACRDRTGFLWVASREGLFRFDGVEYRPAFRLPDRGLGGLLTTIMLHDRRGRVWVTADSGTVACVDAATTTVFAAGRDVPGLKPMSIAEGADGAVWLAYFRTRYLCRIADGRAQIVPANADGEHDPVQDLYGTPQGDVWFTSGNRLGALRNGRLETLVRLGAEIGRATPAADGGLWLVSGGRLWRWSGRDAPRDVAAAPAAPAQRLHEDRRGRLWIATAAEGGAELHVLDGAACRAVPIWSPAITSLSSDDEDNLWVGSRRTGLIQVRPRTVELTTPLGEAPPGIQSVCEDAVDGSLYMVGSHGQFLHQNAANWRRSAGWRDLGATCVATHPGGGAWVGTRDHGLHLYRDGEFSTFGTDAGVPLGVIRTVMSDRHGAAWIGVDRFPLQRLFEGRAASVPGAPQDVVVVIPAADGIWAASADGRLLHGDASGLTDRTPPRARTDRIRSLFAGADGTLWIGFASGTLGRLVAPDTFHAFPVDFALRDAAITQLVADERGWLWCGTQRGIFRVASAELEKLAAGRAGGVRSILCGVGDGWPALQASGEYWPRSLRRRSGELCLPVSAGLASVEPGRILEQPPQPVVLITSLQVNGQPLPLPAPGPADQGTPLVDVGRGVRQLGVEFGVISFIGRDNVRYRYRLQGFDDEWVDAGPQDVAYFSMLPPGRYRFHVTACSNKNVWNNAGAMIDIVVAARYWETAWFRWLSWLTLGGLLGAAVWWESRRRVRRQLERLEREHALDRERERIARDMHDDLGADLSNIATLADVLGNASDDATRSRLGELGGLAENVVRRLEEIVWAVNPENDSVDRFASFLCRVVQSHLEPAGIAARFDVPVDLPDAPLSSQQRHNLLLAAKEALHNAVRHGAPNQIAIGVSLRGGRLEVTVADDGRGFIATEDLPPGHGSANMRRRMLAVDGSFERLSAPGLGTTVILSVPLSFVASRPTP